MGRRRENMLEAFKASHDQAVRNQRAAEAVEASRRIRAMVTGGDLDSPATDAPASGAGPEDAGPRPPIPVESAAGPAVTGPPVTGPPVTGVVPGATSAGLAAAPAAPAESRSSQAHPSGPGAGANATEAQPKRARWAWRKGKQQKQQSATDKEQALQDRKARRAEAAASAPKQAAAVGYADPNDPSEPVTLPMGWVPFFVLQALVVVGAFGLGWLASNRSSQPANAEDGAAQASILGTEGLVLGMPGAAHSTTPGGQAEDADASPLRVGREPVDAPAGLGAPLGDGSHGPDSAFDNPVNRFTIVVAQYADTDFGRERAWDTYQYLEESGLPAVSPRARNGTVFLFAGAAAQVADLGALLDQIRTLQDRRGREFPFNDAYTANISRFL